MQSQITDSHFIELFLTSHSVPTWCRATMLALALGLIVFSSTAVFTMVAFSYLGYV